MSTKQWDSHQVFIIFHVIENRKNYYGNTIVNSLLGIKNF